jgi:hypothetical protein
MRFRFGRKHPGASGSTDHPVSPSRSGPTDHPVFSLRPGLDRATVLDRLGPPTDTMTSEQLAADYKTTIVVGKAPPPKEWWLYEDTPAGHEIRIVMSSGRLTSAEVFAQSGGASERIWSTDAG